MTIRNKILLAYFGMIVAIIGMLGSGFIANNPIAHYILAAIMSLMAILLFIRSMKRGDFE